MRHRDVDATHDRHCGDGDLWGREHRVALLPGLDIPLADLAVADEPVD